mgnify:CR=1 FL=1|jgi:hypothetical protein
MLFKNHQPPPSQGQPSVSYVSKKQVRKGIYPLEKTLSTIQIEVLWIPAMLANLLQNPVGTFECRQSLFRRYFRALARI